MFWMPTYDFNCKICDYHPWALVMFNWPSSRQITQVYGVKIYFDMKCGEAKALQIWGNRVEMLDQITNLR